MGYNHDIRKVVLMDSVISAITQVGFPIVMVLLMWYLFIHFYDSITAELDKFRTSIDANTQAISKLVASVDPDEKGKAE